MAENFKDTLNLPQTAFPMRGDLATREPRRLAQWEAEDLYSQTLENRKGAPSYILADGPPYANGDIHLGHALNKILKDIHVRYANMRGFRSPYVPGWDCHGLPIEQQILKQVGPRIHEMEALELRKMCAAYAQRYIAIQREQFKRLGILGDWENPYVTMDPVYEAGIIETLRELVSRGLIIKGHRVVHWDPVFRTALAEAEIEYHPHRSPSIFVAFPLLGLAEGQELPTPLAGKNAAIVIWTTTPWTLPANLGISLHPDFDYVAVDCGERSLVVAKELAESFIAACQLEGATVSEAFKASSLDRASCAHPFFEHKTSLVMLGEHVTLEQGTGCVHTAPGHGADDFAIGQRYGLPTFVPVDAAGCYTEDFPAMQGTFVFDANEPIVKDLQERGWLLGHRRIEHEYPFSWRSKQPILFRATEQWFMQLDSPQVREKALELIDHEVQWIPVWGRERIRGMVERRKEWCISRQRSWGVPIPSLRSKITGRSHLLEPVLGQFRDIVSKEGTDAWFARPAEDFIPAGFTGPDGESATDWEKEFDILDVWFDSGASHIASTESNPQLGQTADLYLEGSDQHRGWFQAALLTCVGARGKAPFKAVLTHGFVLDGEGRAMSKSMGNVISPLDLIEKYGADILRLWVNSLDYADDVAISEGILQNIARAYRDIRNTLRFQLGNLYDFDQARDALPLEQLLPLDQWALAETGTLIDKVTSAYENHEFHRAFTFVTQFCTTTLSALYHDILKDRLYTFGARSEARRSAQTVIAHQFDVLSRLLAPVLVFTADEARAFHRSNEESDNRWAALEDWPTAPASWGTLPQAPLVARLLDELRPAANEKLEQLRKQKTIGKSIEAALTLHAPVGAGWEENLPAILAHLPELLIVSRVTLGQPSPNGWQVSAEHAGGIRCPRCLRQVEELTPTAFGDACPRCVEALHPAE